MIYLFFALILNQQQGIFCMNKIVLFLFFITSFSALGQKTISATDYAVMKSNGKISATQNFKVLQSTTNNQLVLTPNFKAQKANRAANNCGCYIQPDTSYTLAMQPNDDGSTALINLPFTFCFYGTSQNSLFINNNGNVSFGVPYSTFTGASFPNTNFVMVAPFFGDVDTRLDAQGIDGGEVWYKITPTAIIVNWLNVGYYSTQNDKRNSFQLIITDGTDPLIPNGNNVAFCYDDMQWTTGAASGGTNGFGGTPSTVGANLGNGTDFIQFGRFDTAGTIYDGPYGNSDGISWLDYQSMYFNACNSTNTPPIVTGLNSCDTIGVCRDDTLNFNLSFISPEPSQTTTISINSSFPGLTVTNITSGVNAELDAYVVGGLSNVGFQTLQIMAVDDGTPAETTYVDLVIFVDSTILNPVITSSDSTLCLGDSTILDVGTGYDNYQWSTGAVDTSDIVAFSGIYTVTVTQGLCVKSSASYDVVTIDPQPNINRDFLCAGDSLILFVTDTFDTYLWSTGDTIDSTVINSPGTFTVDVTSFGCTGSDTVTVNQVPLPVPQIVGDTFYCHTDSVMLTTSQAFVSYVWSTNETSTTITAGAGITSVMVTDTNNCSGSSAPFTVIQVIPDAQILGDTLICDAANTTLLANPVNQSFLWSTNDTTTSIQVGIGTYALTVTDTLGCIDSNRVTVTQGVNPVAKFTSNPPLVGIKNTPVDFTDQSTIPFGTIDFWTYSFGDNDSAFTANPSHVYGQEGVYTILLTVVSDFGCIDTVSANLSIIDELIGPNIITPNGDFMNDYLEFPGLAYFPPAHLQIFNRWGVLLYESEHYLNTWDAYNIADGTYYYILEIPEMDMVIKKSFTILRSDF